jgi:hypothetical protein
MKINPMALILGLGAVYMFTKDKDEKKGVGDGGKRAGEGCDPLLPAPAGYICAETEPGKWALQPVGTGITCPEGWTDGYCIRVFNEFVGPVGLGGLWYGFTILDTEGTEVHRSQPSAKLYTDAEAAHNGAKEFIKQITGA